MVANRTTDLKEGNFCTCLFSYQGNPALISLVM